MKMKLFVEGIINPKSVKFQNKKLIRLSIKIDYAKGMLCTDFVLFYLPFTKF